MIKEMFFDKDKYRKTYQGKRFTVKKDNVYYYTLVSGGVAWSRDDFVLAKNTSYTITDAFMIGAGLFYVFDAFSCDNDHDLYINFNKRDFVAASDVVLQNGGVISTLLTHLYQGLRAITNRKLVAAC